MWFQQGVCAWASLSQLVWSVLIKYNGVESIVDDSCRYDLVIVDL